MEKHGGEKAWLVQKTGDDWCAKSVTWDGHDGQAHGSQAW